MPPNLRKRVINVGNSGYGIETPIVPEAHLNYLDEAENYERHDRSGDILRRAIEVSVGRSHPRARI